ncbi:hypothetical protein GO013_15145 [Pseudodesulfovibrio sp. JC047]|uniref:hypothetical protein n=1 Tax=Pseudodesulfovibrio sp. JC047 TaxID=2683199 RepID=UPI0013D4D8AA|nr:hypothetical protein [Pseudodesulfovibrio sp. JC047]NDV20744.1 hypothetical protein [Pseudodesulfovibrio sp. JC047]
MLFSTPAKDRYCKFTYNFMTGEYERDWVEYADGVFEPLRRDFISLDTFHDGKREYVFNYEEGERLPYFMTVNGNDYALEYDQVGTLKAVVSSTGNVVKAIQYDAFGNLLWDSNPGLRIPLGFTETPDPFVTPMQEWGKHRKKKEHAR